MLRRLLVGLILGLLIGGFAGYGLLQVWPMAMAGALAYALAAAVAVFVALVAGKPIWAKGAIIEVGLKAVVGAALGAGLLFGLRFVPLSIPTLDLPVLGTVAGAQLGRHLFGALISVATLLSVFYELDNDDTAEADAPKKARVAGGAKARIAGDPAVDEAEELEERPARKRR
jgi:hypothetical protein